MSWRPHGRALQHCWLVVLSRTAELLPVHARAELVAGLQAVDYVAVDCAAPPADRTLHLDDEDDRRLRELRGLVKEKDVVRRGDC